MDQPMEATQIGAGVAETKRETRLGGLLDQLENCNRQLFEQAGALEGFHARLGGTVPLSEVAGKNPEIPSNALDRLAAEIDSYGAGISRLQSALSNLQEIH